jgi:hypothetical protein
MIKHSILLAAFTLGSALAAPKPAGKPATSASGVLQSFEKAQKVAEDFTHGDSLKMDAPLDGQSAGSGWQGSWAGDQAFEVIPLVIKKNTLKLSFPACVKANTPGERKGEALTIQRTLQVPIPKETETWVEFYLTGGTMAGRTTSGIGLLNSEGKLILGVSKDGGAYGEDSSGKKIAGFLRLFDSGGVRGQNVSPQEEKVVLTGFGWDRVLLRISNASGHGKAEAWVNPEESAMVSEPGSTLEFEASDIAAIQLRARDFYDNVPGDPAITGLTIKTIK